MTMRLLRSDRFAWRHVCRSLLLLSMVLVGSTATAEPQDIIVSPCNNINTTFGIHPGQAVPANTRIAVSNGGNVFWGFTNTSGVTACTGSSPVFTCAGMTVTIPDPNVAQPNTSTVTITGTASGSATAQGKFTLTVTDAADGSKTCDATYLLHTTTDVGGWGDPHLILTNTEGSHWDYQSAGEFTALREKEFEVQTRQSPVPTATIPVANGYTGLSSCVSLYTAVAARIGSNRVTLQPTLVGEPDPKSMELRVNGQLVSLTDRGIFLVADAGKGTLNEGRIMPAADNQIEITDTRGTQLVLTPKFWDSQHRWYLNVNVYQTSAVQGTLSRIADGSWLPALSDGSNVGQRPDSAQERYQQLYVKFADSWRVTDSTSLFDYAPGTNTATFTLAEWPRFNAQSCGIQGQTSVQPATQAVADAACAPVTNAAQKADCVFDVMVTGETGFAASYVSMQGFKPHGIGFQPQIPGSSGGGRGGGGTGGGGGGGTQPWPWWWWILLLILILIIIIVWFVRRKSTP
jgi:hypothetical protein